MLDVKNLTVRLGGMTILDKISFSVSEGQWLMIVGPNGAGKSTVINAVSQGIPYTGEVLFESKDIKKFRPRQLAGIIGVLAQSYYVGYSFTVEDIVRLGRYAYSKGIFLSKGNSLHKSRSQVSGGSSRKESDENFINTALEMTGISGLRNRSVLTLSGGELQRTFLAQIMAQDPRIILLDEPSNHLDLVYQKQIFELIRDWKNKPGKAVISVVHDISLAKLFGTDAVLINNGGIASFGEINNVLTADNLNPVYQMDLSKWMHDLLSQWK